MGDRGNVEMVYEGEKKIYLYTHWNGSELPGIVRSALIRGKDRWDDPAYLARIIFCEMIQDSVLDETGYGIAPYMLDNQHPVISVRCYPEQSITIKSVGQWSFEEFIDKQFEDLPS